MLLGCADGVSQIEAHRRAPVGMNLISLYFMMLTQEYGLDASELPRELLDCCEELFLKPLNPNPQLLGRTSPWNLSCKNGVVLKIRVYIGII